MAEDSEAPCYNLTTPIAVTPTSPMIGGTTEAMQGHDPADRIGHVLGRVGLRMLHKMVNGGGISTPILKIDRVGDMGQRSPEERSRIHRQKTLPPMTVGIRLRLRLLGIENLRKGEDRHQFTTMSTRSRPRRSTITLSWVSALRRPPKSEYANINRNSPLMLTNLQG